MRTLALLAAALVASALAAAAAAAAAAPETAPDYRQIGRSGAIVTFHNGCVIDYRMGKRRSVSRYCTAAMTAAADRRAALGGAFRVNGAIAAPLVIRLPGGGVQVGFAGVACNYLFNARGQLVRAMGSYCNATLYTRAAELQSRVPRR